MMNIRHLAIVAASLGLTMASHAAQPQSAQREKMKACHAEAKAGAMKGDARKAFMKTCLSKGSANKGAAAPAKAVAPARP